MAALFFLQVESVFFFFFRSFFSLFFSSSSSAARLAPLSLSFCCKQSIERASLSLSSVRRFLLCTVSSPFERRGLHTLARSSADLERKSECVRALRASLCIPLEDAKRQRRSSLPFFFSSPSSSSAAARVNISCPPSLDAFPDSLLFLSNTAA